MKFTQRAFFIITLATSSLLGMSVEGRAQEPIEIRMASDFALSPDGETLVFRWANELWSTSIEPNGSIKRLTNHPAVDSQPRFSPNGKQIAFISNRSGSNQIYVMPAEGGIPQQKTFHSEGYSLADWFPDGNSVLAVASRDHFWRGSNRMMQIDLTKRSAEKMLLDDAAANPKLSNDGKKILFTREGERWWRKGYRGERAAQIWMLDLQSGATSELLHEKVESLWPLWMPGGKGFYFAKGTDHGLDLWRYRFSSDDQPARQRKVLGFQDDSIAEPTISRNGSTIVFRHLFDTYVLHPGKDDQPIKLDLKVASDTDLPEDIQRNTVNRADQVAFTDDGLEIAFTLNGDLWLMDTELKEPIQVTRTDGYEESPIFSNDGKSLWFTRKENGQVDLWKVEPKEPTKYWWQQKEFVETRMSESAGSKSNLRFTPNGKHLLFVQGRGNLVAMNVDTKEITSLVESFSEPSFSISPDSRWIAYDSQDNDFNSEIWIMPLDKHAPAVNVSRHPDNDQSPVFSPDGKILAFTGRRSKEESDIYYVYLQKEFDDESSRDRTIEKAIETMKKKRPKSAGSEPKADGGSQDTKTLENKNQENKPSESKVSDPKTAEEKPKPEKATEPEPKLVRIDFDKIHQRLRRINLQDTRETNLIFSPDGKKLAFSASVEGKSGWYSVEFPDKLTPKIMSSTVLSDARWTKSSGSILGLSKGTPTKLENGEKETGFGFSVTHDRSRSGRFREGFNAAWLAMNEIWYDPAMGNRNWEQIRRKYADAASRAFDERGLAEVIELMLGELNGSHLGFTPSIGSTVESDAPRKREHPTAHLGARFDPSHLGPGLKVRDVLPESPSDKAKSRLKAGDIILSIDGTRVDPSMDLTQVLNGPLDRDIQLVVQRAKDDGSEELNLSLRPIPYGRLRPLLYEQWLETNRQMVEKLSNGKLGYLHIQAMDESSFLEFEQQLYNVGYGKEGLVIDVRDNGGGSTTDHLLTSLTQPKHAITVPRGGGTGYPHDRMIYATWSKPIVVLCNQNSYSNAEIFSHAIKALGRGKLVGVQTAGGVVSTGVARVNDIGVLRAPFRGWFSIRDGSDMELHGAEPDFVIWPAPGEIPAGIDKQLEIGVDVLLEEVAKVPALPKPKYATGHE
ncbi:MAG: S41 family peptidase [Planctomycetaceae bacterium]|jgi:tricorn protease|nr:S41 family peptidase [Planctomycetaceae bacterium]